MPTHLYSTSGSGTEPRFWLPTGVRFGKSLTKLNSTVKAENFCLSACPLWISGTFIWLTSHLASVMRNTKETAVPSVKFFGWEVSRGIKRKQFCQPQVLDKNWCSTGLLADCNLSNMVIKQTHSCMAKLPITFFSQRAVWNSLDVQHID